MKRKNVKSFVYTAALFLAVTAGTTVCGFENMVDQGDQFEDMPVMDPYNEYDQTGPYEQYEQEEMMPAFEDVASGETQESSPMPAAARETEAETGRYSPILLIETGTIVSARDVLSFAEDGLIYMESEGGYYFCDRLGNVFPDLNFERFKKITDSVFVLTRTVDGIEETTLVDAEGEILIPFGVYKMEKKSDRFLLLTAENDEENPEGPEGEDQDRELFSPANPDDEVWDEEFDISREEEETFTGYRVLYDLDNRCFVEESRTVSGTETYWATSDSFAVIDGETYTVSVFSGDGECIEKEAPVTGLVKDHYIQKQGEDLTVYDGELNILAQCRSVKDYLGGTYVSFEEPGGKTGVMDFEGTQVIDPVYDEITYLGEGFFRVGVKKDEVDEELVYGIKYVSEEEDVTVSDCLYKEITPLSDQKEGIWVGEREDGENSVYDLYDEDGIIYQGIAVAPDPNFLVCGQKGEQLCYLVEKDRGFTVDVSSQGVKLKFATAAFQDPATGTWEAYNLLNGQQLFAKGFEELHYAYGSYYAYTGSGFRIYQEQ